MSGTWWVDEEDIREEQLEVLEFDEEKNLLIVGPPGSGKTNLLLLRANHLHISHQPEFYIVAYTALLSKFIKTGASLYSFPANKIVTQDKLFETVLGDHGYLVPRREGESFAQRQSSLRDGMERLMKAGAGKHSFPVLFIDEAQDYSEYDLTCFFYLGKNVWLSADVRQGIYDNGSGSLAILAEKCPDTITLTYHYRVGRKIIEVADRLMAGKLGHVAMLPSAQYNEERYPSSVDVEGPMPLEQQVNKAVARLLTQLRAYPNEKLGVLIPRKVEVPLVWAALQSVPELAGKVTNAHDRNFDPDMPIWLSTVHSAKGLEFRSVHLLCADLIANFKAYSRRLAFTAITRAKTALIIYYDEELPPFLAAAVASEKKTKISLKAVLGKQK